MTMLSNYRWEGQAITVENHDSATPITVTECGKDIYLIEQGAHVSKVVGVKTATGIWVHWEGHHYFFERIKPERRRRGSGAHAAGADITAPMPGKILKLAVMPGDTVSKGDLLCILEAMKMEHRLIAPRDGTVSEVLVKEGDVVDAGKRLVDLE